MNRVASVRAILVLRASHLPPTRKKLLPRRAAEGRMVGFLTGSLFREASDWPFEESAASFPEAALFLIDSLRPGHLGQGDRSMPVAGQLDLCGR
jgi:hypothetical protein